MIQLDVAGSRTTLDSRDVLALPTANSLGSVIAASPGVGETSVRGGNADETQLMINGVVATDMRLATYRVYTVPLTSVQEVQVLMSGFSPEYGDVRSGVINVVTRDDPRNYWLNSDITFAPAQKKHFAGDTYADAYGDNTLEWNVFGTTAAMTTPYSTENVVTGNVEQVFDGWLAEAGNNQALADSMQTLWRHYHRLTADDYANSPDYSVDVSVGGPVPGIGGSSFTFSHRNTQVLYGTAVARDAYTSFTEQLMLTFRIADEMKLSLLGTYTSESGVGYINEGNFAGGVGQGIYRGGFPLTANQKYATHLLPRADNTYITGGLTFTHMVSERTQYEIGVGVQSNDYNISPWDMRYTTTGVVNSVWNDDRLGGSWANLSPSDPAAVAPAGYYPIQMNDLTAFPFAYELGSSPRNVDSSSYSDYNLQASITSQVNAANQIKAGFVVRLSQIHEYRGRGFPDDNEARWLKYDKDPLRVAAYVQDKIEHEGMIMTAGARFDYFDARANVYEWDEPFTNLWFKGKWINEVDRDLYQWLEANKDYGGQTDSISIQAADPQWALAPRLAISHPLDAQSKVYFNYGHFYTYPQTQFTYGFQQGSVGDLWTEPNPNLEFPRTIMYELAIEREFSNSLYAGWLGHEVQPTFLVKIAGYYKDVSRIVRDIRYAEGTVTHARPVNKGYQEIRGFEITLSKRAGRFLTGQLQGELSLTDQGNIGNVTEYLDPRIDPDPESPYEAKSVAEPSWAAQINLHTPPGFSAFGLPAMATEQWLLSMRVSYAKGTRATYNPNNETPAPAENVRNRDSWGSTLRLSKGLTLGRARAAVYLDISNLFGYKTIWSGSMTGTEWNAYLKSLHFPIDDPNIEDTPGEDRIGDFPSYAKLPAHDEWAHFLNPRTYTLGLRLSF